MSTFQGCNNVIGFWLKIKRSEPTVTPTINKNQRMWGERIIKNVVQISDISNPLIWKNFDF